MKKIITAAALTLASLIFCILILTVDTAPIGPMGTTVGFSRINKAVSDAIGVNMFWYKLTQALGVIAIAAGMCFALLGVYQLVRGKSLKKVDGRVLALGGLYVVLGVVYFLFEKAALNYRPVIMPGSAEPEASFPSSHTVLICVIAASVFMMLRYYPVKNASVNKLLRAVCVAVAAVAVVGRLLSGVHWLTDILGGVIISAALIAWFGAALDHIGKRRNNGRWLRR